MKPYADTVARLIDKLKHVEYSSTSWCSTIEELFAVMSQWVAAADPCRRTKEGER